MNAKEARDMLFSNYEQDVAITKTLEVIYNIISYSVKRGENKAKIHREIFGDCLVLCEGNGDYGDYYVTEFNKQQDAIIRILKSKGYTLELPSGNLYFRDYLTVMW